MRIRNLLICLAILAKALCFSASYSIFPSHIHLSSEDAIFLLDKTGEAAKEGVYTIAHYLQGAIADYERVVLFKISNDGDAKELIINWERDFSSAEVQDEFHASFTEALTPSEFIEHKDHIEEFLLSFDRDVKIGEQMRLLWMKEGAIYIYSEGEFKREIKSIPFAKALWKLWFGPRSVVQRSLLIDDFVVLENREIS